MQIDATAVTALLRAIIPAIIWLWLLGSVTGGLYALRLWRRARGDVRRLRASGRDGALAYNANGTLRRVQVRVLMFGLFLLLTSSALVLMALPLGMLREVVRLGYVLAGALLIVALTYNARQDEQHDRVLRVLLRKEERKP
jgi:hypothetical protein